MTLRGYKRGHLLQRISQAILDRAFLRKASFAENDAAVEV